MARTSVVLVQAGSPPEDIRRPLGDYPAWFCRTLGLSPQEVEIVRVFQGEALPAPDPARVAVFTGSWAMVTERLPWSEATAQWIRDAMAVDMPLFGVCYGHQLMAHALGGQVGYHPDGAEVGCHAIHLNEAAAGDPMLAGMPRMFPAHLTHSQSVIAVPPGATVLAASDHDPHQIIRYAPRAMSVQFHPEFDTNISRAIIHYHASHLRETGNDPGRLLAQVREAPDAEALMRRFVAQARSPLAT